MVSTAPNAPIRNVPPCHLGLNTRAEYVQVIKVWEVETFAFPSVLYAVASVHRIGGHFEVSNRRAFKINCLAKLNDGPKGWAPPARTPSWNELREPPLNVSILVGQGRLVQLLGNQRALITMWVGDSLATSCSRLAILRKSRANCSVDAATPENTGRILRTHRQPGVGNVSPTQCSSTGRATVLRQRVPSLGCVQCSTIRVKNVNGAGSLDQDLQRSRLFWRLLDSNMAQRRHGRTNEL